MGEYFVYVVQGDSVIQQKVQTGADIRDQIVIREGLEENTEIVTEGIQKLKNGAKITKGGAERSTVNGQRWKVFFKINIRRIA